MTSELRWQHRKKNKTKLNIFVAALIVIVWQSLTGQEGIFFGLVKHFINEIKYQTQIHLFRAVVILDACGPFIIYIMKFLFFQINLSDKHSGDSDNKMKHAQTWLYMETAAATTRWQARYSLSNRNINHASGLYHLANVILFRQHIIIHC